MRKYIHYLNTKSTLCSKDALFSKNILPKIVFITTKVKKEDELLSYFFCSLVDHVLLLDMTKVSPKWLLKLKVIPATCLGHFKRPSRKH